MNHLVSAVVALTLLFSVICQIANYPHGLSSTDDADLYSADSLLKSVANNGKYDTRMKRALNQVYFDNCMRFSVYSISQTSQQTSELQ
jgi:hypothetical protein